MDNPSLVRTRCDEGHKKAKKLRQEKSRKGLENYTFINMNDINTKMIPNSPRFIKHSSVVMTQRLNIIYKNRLHNFLLRLERSTCVQEKLKQKRKQKALHGLLQ